MGDMLSYAPAQSYLTLYVPTDCSPPGSSVHEIIPARILGGLSFPPPGDLPVPGIKATSLVSPALAVGFFITSTTWKARMKT